MTRLERDSEPQPVDAVAFQTTHWSVVLAAGWDSSAHARAALEQLCRAYWFPLYAYVRRQGHSEHDAQDLTQAFFARFLEKQHVRLADRERGRFRSFLLTSLKHFLVNEWEKGRTAKRGAGESSLSLDTRDAEGRYLAEPSDEMTPDRVYEKRWAVALVESVLARLRTEYDSTDRLTLFDALKGHVWGDENEGYSEVAARLQTTEGALRIAAHRMRDQFRRLLRQEVAHTVASPEEIDAELRHLISVLRT